jgi:hypothetical protein
MRAMGSFLRAQGESILKMRSMPKIKARWMQSVRVTRAKLLQKRICVIFL